MKNATPLPFALQRRTARPSTQRGITTVQIAIGILVSVIALVGSFGGFQYVAQAKVNTDVAAMLDLKAATQRYGTSLGSGGFTTSNMTTATLINLGFFGSSGFVLSGTIPSQTVANQYGGAVTAAVPTSTTDEIATLTEGISFTWNGLPSAACRELALRLDTLAWSVQAKPGSGTLQKVKSLGAAMSPANAATGCASAKSDNTLTVTFSRS